MTFKIKLPEILISIKRGNNNIIKLIEIGIEENVQYKSYRYKSSLGYLLLTEKNEKLLILTEGSDVEQGTEKVLKIKGGKYDDFDSIAQDQSNLIWYKHPSIIENQPNIEYLKTQSNAARLSFLNSFTFKEEVRNSTGQIEEFGLRNPQIGAIHSVLAHWAVSNEIATVVIPTGVGKTEVMLSLLAVSKAERIMVIVPTDALRFQIARKFITLGVLKDVGVISKSAIYPTVGILKSKFKTLEEIDDYFEACNVIITTINIAGQSEKAIQARMASNCSHLFIDEAHHSEADTWKEFRKLFKQKKTIQFTATPFRADGKTLDGKTIFNYPLSKAQEEDYFKPIEYIPINEYDPNKRDVAIAEKAISLLKEDREKYNHVLMARVKNIYRAEEVFKIYEKHKEFNPVQIHTGLSNKDRDIIRKKILAKRG